MPVDVSDSDLGTAINVLQDAIGEARADAKRAESDGDRLGTEHYNERVKCLRRVIRWLEEVDI